MNGWLKGALHTHTLWSDSPGLPENMAVSYRDRGFDFLCCTDHNVYADDRQMWRELLPDEGDWPHTLSRAEFSRFAARFGANKAEVKKIGFKTFVRLRTFDELKREMEIPGRFLMIGGEEITGWLDLPDGERHAHLVYLNIPKTIPFAPGRNVAEMIKINRNAVEQAAAECGVEDYFVMLNHTHWRYFDVTPEDVIANPELRHMEICNKGACYPIPEGAYSADKLYDVVNAHRVEAGLPVIWCAASDDSHFYDPRRIDGSGGVNDAWVMVRGERLDTTSVIGALNRGDYYPTCGVLLDAVEFDPASGRLHVDVHALPGVNYRIRFVATRRGFDHRTGVLDYKRPAEAPARVIHTYSDEIGRTVKTVSGVAADCQLDDNDLYLRAVIESDQPVRAAQYYHPRFQCAWTQPYTMKENK
ncbi:MAG: hypothetical protein PHI35_07510 [Victivallaceae bacterium]|nr:hypothetical protein [Victivallaceae bacterium]